MKSSNSVSSLRRDLIEWICHIMIYSCDSENRMEIAVSIFDPLLTNYIDDSGDENHHDFDFQLKVIDCMLHVCDRKAFKDERESESTVNKEDEKKRQTSDDDALESFSYGDWKKHGESIQRIWEYFAKESNNNASLERRYHYLMVKIQFYMILKWMDQKREIESRIEFPSDNSETYDIENVLSKDFRTAKYIELGRGILMKTGIQNDADDPLFRIFASLLENKPVIIDHIHLKDDYSRAEINLHKYQSELQKFLEDCYKIKIPMNPKLMLSYPRNEEEQTSDLLLTTMNNTMKKMLTTKEKENEDQNYDSNEQPKEYKKGLVGISEESFLSFGSDVERNEEEEIKKKRKERKKEKQHKTGYRKNAIRQRKPVPVNQSDSLSKLNAEDCNQDEFASTIASLGSTSTFFHDATSVLLPRKAEKKRSGEEYNSSKAPNKEDKDSNFASRKSMTPKRKLERTTDTNVSEKNNVSCDTTQSSPSSKRSKASNYVMSQAEMSKNVSYNKKKPIFRRAKRPFTYEEMDAIKKGVRKYGAGKWKEIKDEYNNSLRDRTTVNIKDCYRNMLRRGDINKN